MRSNDCFRWEVGQTYAASDYARQLHNRNFFSFYDSPLLAMLHNPIHADISRPRLFEASVWGEEQRDGQMRCEWTNAKLMKELAVPRITPIQYVAYGILCSLEIYKDKGYVKWARDWLSGKDRSIVGARAVARCAVLADDTAEIAFVAASGAQDAVFDNSGAYIGACIASYVTHNTTGHELNLGKIAKETMKIT